jgi:hypothetical protein
MFTMAVLAVMGAWVPSHGQELGPGYRIEMSRMIPVRDAVELEAWITKPTPSHGRVPTVLEITQYDIDGGRRGEPSYFALHGYAFVQVYVRGRGRSGGVKSDNLGLQVGRDGYDIVEWIAHQDWSNGQVVMYGGSFVGMTQWRTAAQRPPHLSAIAPYVAIYPGWDIPNNNGIPEAQTGLILAYTSGRSLNTRIVTDPSYLSGTLLAQYAAFRPFSELDQAVGIAAADDWWMPDKDGDRIPMMTMWLDHVGDEAFNLAAEPKDADLKAMSIPVLTATGYFDDDQQGALHYYRRHVAQSAPAVAAKHYLVLGPWDHFGTQQPSKVIENLTIPDSAVLDMNKLRLDWYEAMLGRGLQPAFLKDRVAYFMMGANQWRYAPTLEEVASKQSLTLYLADPDGTPRSVFRSGELRRALPGEQPPAELVADPRELPELDMKDYLADEGLTSQFRAFQKRALVFHSEPFEHDTEIAGQVRLLLECSADAADFDLWAQLLLVNADGSAVQLGLPDIRRARFRNGFFKQELVVPGKPIEIPFEFSWTAWRIPAGARLRLVLAPLNSPDYQKNYNSGGRIGYESLKDARAAHVRIYHDQRRASRLIIPLAASSL